MLTTIERDKLKSTERRYRNLRREETAQQYADELVELLAADDREMFDCSESIARGEACLSCGARWVPDHVVHYGPNSGALVRKLDHRDGCVYSSRLMEEDL